MPNSLAAGALPNTGADAGPISAQGPQVDAKAMETPPTPPTGGAGGADQPSSPADVKDMIHKQAVVDAKLRQLLDEGGPIPRKEVITVATELVADRVMSAQSIAGYLSDLPEDPEAIREWVQRHANDAENHLQQMLVMLHGSEAPQGAAGGGPGMATGAPPGMPPGQMLQ